MCVCDCVCERESVYEKERESVCVTERERECVCVVYVCLCMRESVCAHFSMLQNFDCRLACSNVNTKYLHNKRSKFISYEE